MDDNDELTAERILEERYNEDHQLQYLIKWEGEEEEYATWESYDEVSGSWSHLLDEWEFKLKNMKRNHKHKSIMSVDEDHNTNSTNTTNTTTTNTIPIHTNTTNNTNINIIHHSNNEY
eukprot:801669_1